MALNLFVHCTKGYSRRILCSSFHAQRFLNTNIKQYGQSFKSGEDQQKRKAVKVYLLQRLIRYIRNYDVHLKAKFPKAMQLYQVFMEGVKVFYEDLKSFMKIIRIVYASPPKTPFVKLTRRELELYHQLPRDIFKVTPILVLSAVPFSLYVILPLIYYFPRQLLSSHFWTLQQKSEFRVLLLKNRLVHNRPVFRHMQSQLQCLHGHAFYEEWEIILGQLGSGVQPTVDQILECQPIFTRLPYRLNYLSGNHITHLSKMHNTAPFLRRKHLKDKAIVLVAMDRAIMKEGGAHNLPLEALKNACFIRGLNPTNMKLEDMVDWLNQWMKISEVVDEESYSLILHCPILLGYNQPSNWSLIYPYRE